MALRDWDGDGKKTSADDFIEYQIYRDMNGQPTADGWAAFGWLVKFMVTSIVSLLILGALVSLFSIGSHRGEDSEAQYTYNSNYTHNGYSSRGYTTTTTARTTSPAARTTRKAIEREEDWDEDGYKGNYEVDEYNDPEDFYEDHYDDFDDEEDAEEYWGRFH